MIVYVDVIFFENLCMNYIILLTSGVIMKIKVNHVRLAFSATLGSIYAIMVYMQIFNIYSNMITKVILSICMVHIAFSPKGIKILLKELTIFYLVSFVFGGCAFALLYFIKPQDIFIKNGVYIGTYPIKIVLLGGIVGFVVVRIAFKILRNRINKKCLIYEIEIKIEEKKKIVKAMLDTGNMLKDPITREPVIVVEKEELREVLSDEIVNNTEKIIGGDWEGCREEINFRARFRIIPFQSIGKKNGMLLGFKSDGIKIKTEIEDIDKKNIVIGIYNGKMTKTNTYSALIGLDIFEGSEENEHFANVKI